MKVTIGEAGLAQTWQDEFPKTTPCVQPYCGGECRIGFVAHEKGESVNNSYVCELHPNEGGCGGDFWLHDACAVAVYFCKKCLNTTALYNQA